jgi:SAM-dependent methyltransferase
LSEAADDAACIAGVPPPATRPRRLESEDIIMDTSTVLFPGRFRRLADVYARGRPPYPSLLAQRVAAFLGLDGSQDVLDLGTGPGFLAIDYYPFARRVVGVDPEPEMLRVAAEMAHRNGADIEFIQGSSATIGPELGRFRAVTIGRAFHWMDRRTTLAALDAIIEPGGAVVLFSESFPAVPANDWYPKFRTILDAYAMDDPAREILTHGKDHETVLLTSAFSHLERMSVLERRATPLESLVDRALSFARAWDGRPGARSDQLVQVIRSALTPFVVDDAVNEVIEGTALIARRPRDVEWAHEWYAGPRR